MFFTELVALLYSTALACNDDLRHLITPESAPEIGVEIQIEPKYGACGKVLVRVPTEHFNMPFSGAFLYFGDPNDPTLASYVQFFDDEGDPSKKFTSICLGEKELEHVSINVTYNDGGTFCAPPTLFISKLGSFSDLNRKAKGSSGYSNFEKLITKP